jgi:hypothetical protein
MIKKDDFVKLNINKFEYGNCYNFNSHKRVMNHINSGNDALKVEDVCNFKFPYKIMINNYPLYFKEKELIKIKE